MTQKAQATATTKIDKLAIKIKNFCASKDTIKKMKRQPKAWEKMFAIHISDEGLVSRMYKHDHNSIKRQIIQKRAKEPAHGRLQQLYS